MSTRVCGCSTFNFIKSISVVPPAMKRMSAPCCAVFAFAADSDRLSVICRPRELESLHPGFWLRALPHTLNRGHDVRIRAAAADVAAHEFLHLRVLRPARLFQQRHRRHDLPGRAIAALVGIAFHERRLHRMQFLRLTDALDRRDLIALVQGGEGETRKLAPAIDVHRARAALAVIASLLRTGQMQMLAQAIEQRRARIDPQIVFLAVNTERYRNSVL